jgi:hypothetical protein
MASAGELAVVFRYRVLIAGGNFGRIRVAYRAAPGFVQLAAQLQFQRVDIADELLMHLLYQLGISAETGGIQIAHLVDESLQLLPRLRAILHYRAKLVENIQALIDLALGIGGIRTLLRRRGLPGNARVAGVHRAAIASVGVGIACCPAGDPVADSTGLACRLTTSTALAATTLASLLTLSLALSLALLSGLATLSLLLSALAASALTLALTLALALSLALTLLLARLRGLRVAVQLAGLGPTLLALALLTLLALTLATLTLTLTTLARLSIGLSTQARELIPKTGQIVHGACERGVL